MKQLTHWTLACTLGSLTLLGCAQNTAIHQDPPRDSRPATLQSHHWRLTQAWTPQGSIDTQWSHAPTNAARRTVALRFGENQLLNVDRLCNSIAGRYQIQQNNIQIDKMVSTMMACNDAGLMQLERNVSQTLGQATHWKITQSPAPMLELQFRNGAKWQLQGQATYETLYGQSERIFLEIAPQKVMCSHPLMQDTPCLQAREIRYNAQGIKESIGAWQGFADPIEGYTHQPGVRNILRLKRYTQPNPPADASQFLYVLDMTVESEIVR